MCGRFSRHRPRLDTFLGKIALRSDSPAFLIRRDLVKLLLVLLVAMQVYLVISNYGWTWLKATVRTINDPAMTRSSRFLFGSEGSEYIDFLASVVPPDKPVVLPEGVGGYGEQNLLQFFLLPRGIPACPCGGSARNSDACAECLLAASHYVPVLGDFPKRSLIEDEKQLVEFDGDSGWFRGVYVPAQASPVRPAPVKSNSIGELVLAAGLSLAVYWLILLAGGAAVYAFLYRESLGWVLAVAFPVGAGLITWLVFLMAWGGLSVSSLSYFLAFIMLIAPATIWVLTRPSGHPSRTAIGSLIRSNFSLPKPRLVTAILAFAVLALLGLSLVISVGRAYSIYDDIANWALKGYAIAYEGSIFAGRDWGGHTLEYPQNLHLQIAFFRLLDGDVLPGSKALFTLFFASLLGGCFVFWRSMEVRRSIALLGALLLASLPVLFFHSTTGFANLPMSVYLILGMLLYLDGIQGRSVPKQALGSLLLGLSAWTRLEAAMYSIVVAIGLYTVARLFLQERVRPWPLIVPMFVIQLPWLIFYVLFGRVDASSKATTLFVQESILSGSIRPEIISALIRQIEHQAGDYQTWGAAFPLFLLALVFVVWRAFRRKDRLPLATLFLLIVAYLAVGLVLYISGLLAGDELEVWIRTRSDRHYFPVAILAVVISILALGRPLGVQDGQSLERAAR